MLNYLSSGQAMQAGTWMPAGCALPSTAATKAAPSPGSQQQTEADFYEPLKFTWTKRRHELRNLARDFSLMAVPEVESSPGSPPLTELQDWRRIDEAQAAWGIPIDCLYVVSTSGGLPLSPTVTYY